MRATGAQGAPAPAIVAGPCGRRLQAGPSPRIPRPARPAPGAAAAGNRTSCRRGRVDPGGRPPATVIVHRAPPTSAVPAAPGPGCVLRAAGLARARRRRARGPRGRRASELGRRRPAEVRAIKGGAGRRGGRSRRGGWGARSGSPWPPRRPAGAPLARRGAAQSGRRPRPRPAPSSPRSPLSAAAAPAPGPAASEAGEREVRGTTTPPWAWAGPSAGGAWAQPGDSGEPQPPPASEPCPAPARPAPPRSLRPGGRCAERWPAGRAAPPSPETVPHLGVRPEPLSELRHQAERGRKSHRREASAGP